MKVKDIISAYPYLLELSRKRASELPDGMAFDLVVLLSKIKPALEYGESERMKLIDAYGQNGEIPKDKVKETNWLLTKAYSVDREIDFMPIEIDAEQIRKYNFSAAELFGASPFIVVHQGEGGE